MLAAEFPNDNPALHEGTIWVCLEVTGAPVAERRLEVAPVVIVPAAVEPSIVDPFSEAPVHPVIETLAEPILPSTLEPIVDVEPAPPPPPPPPRESGIFMTFSSLQHDEEDLDEEGEILVEELGPLEDAVLEQVVAEVAPAIEVADAVAEIAPAPVATIAPSPCDDAYVTFVGALVDIAIAHGASAAAGELPATLDGDKTAQAWAGILRGTSEDWDAIGGSMLDEWAAATLARVTGADANVLKRDLRARGIAAFGLAA